MTENFPKPRRAEAGASAQTTDGDAAAASAIRSRPASTALEHGAVAPRGPIPPATPSTARSPGTTIPLRVPPRFWLRTSGVEPALRIGWLALRLTLRHGCGALGDRWSTASVEARRRARLERSARDTVAVLGRLKGVFAKLGQFAATRPDLVPIEVHDALASLRDRVPPLSLSVARAVVEQALGRSVIEVFARIEHRPIGAASIAQVHRAWLHDGTEVAVKVQYPWLRDSMRNDLAVVRLGLRPLLRARGVEAAAFERLFAEFASGVANELDFEAEADAARRIAQNLASDEAIVVPGVHAEWTRTRMLTLDYVDGVPIERAETLRAQGIDPAWVVEILTRAYARQIFVDGLFHADPHPGNLLAVAGDDPARPRVVFLDFGLSRQLSPQLRQAIRQALFAVLKRDPAAFVEHMHALDMIAPGAEAGVRAAVDSMFDRMGGAVLQQPGSRILALKDEAKALLRETPGLQLPNDLLLYAKTLSYLFQLGDTLAPDVDMMKLAVPHLLRFLAEREPAPAEASGERESAGVSADGASRRGAGPAAG